MSPGARTLDRLLRLDRRLFPPCGGRLGRRRRRELLRDPEVREGIWRQANLGGAP